MNFKSRTLEISFYQQSYLKWKIENSLLLLINLFKYSFGFKIFLYCFYSVQYSGLSLNDVDFSFSWVCFEKNFMLNLNTFHELKQTKIQMNAIRRLLRFVS